MERKDHGIIWNIYCNGNASTATALLKKKKMTGMSGFTKQYGIVSGFDIQNDTNLTVSFLQRDLYSVVVVRFKTQSKYLSLPPIVIHLLLSS